MNEVSDEFGELRNMHGKVSASYYEEARRQGISVSEVLTQSLVGTLEAPMKSLMEQMRDEINSSQYAAVLGEDASGRLPGLLFWEVLKGIYRDKGEQDLRVVFFSGASRDPNDPERRYNIIKLKEYFNNAGLTNLPQGKKILLVTEAIETGSHILPANIALKELGLNFDIATIGFHTLDEYGQYQGRVRSEGVEEAKVRIAKLLEPTRVLFGGYRAGLPLFSEHLYAGVVKRSGQSSQDVQARPFKPQDLESTEWTEEQARQLVPLKRVQSRRAIHGLSNKLKTWYEGKTPKVA